jgi:glutamine synthetase
MAIADVMKMIKENEVKFVDFRFTDTRGKEQINLPMATLLTVPRSPVGRVSKRQTCC